jgi:hypothetical protein
MNNNDQLDSLYKIIRMQYNKDKYFVLSNNEIPVCWRAHLTVAAFLKRSKKLAILSRNSFPVSVILLWRRYFEKAAAKAQSERPYYTDKSSFAVSRGQKWVLENKRPERLRHVRRIS